MFFVMPVPDQVRNDESGIQRCFLNMDWIPAFAGMTGTSHETHLPLNEHPKTIL